MKASSYWLIAVAVLLLNAIPAGAATETVVHSFCQGCSGDGSFPVSRVKSYNGILYGTAPIGGNTVNPQCTDAKYEGCGVVYGIDPSSGKETQLYAFCQQSNCQDGDTPVGNLINVGTTLYGTTAYGGAYGSFPSGTIFSVDPATGAENVAYSFCALTDCADGASPAGGLIAVNGVLYGTTKEGGSSSYCCGVLFSFKPQTNTLSVLYDFGSESPNGDLLNVRGTLYGTTPDTVFSLDLATDTVSVLYTFGGSNDGVAANGGLIDVNGTLYGTTSEGGAHGRGTVFAIDLATGKESVLYSFCSQTSCADGNDPAAGLLNVNGLLYGTTKKGGYKSLLCRGCGVVFSIDRRSGAETVIYRFCNAGPPCSDGDLPAAALVDVRGTIYGTTEWGGAGDGGTVFSLKP